MVVSGLLWCWYTAGLAIVRTIFGTVVPVESEHQQSAQQFSIKRLALITASCALFFAALRFTDFELKNYTSSMLLWLLTSTMLTSFVTLSGIVAAFKFRHTLSAFFVWLFVSGAVLMFHAKVGMEFGVSTADMSRLIWYPIAVLSGVFVFWLARFIHARGYEMVRVRGITSSTRTTRPPSEVRVEGIVASKEPS